MRVLLLGAGSMGMVAARTVSHFSAVSSLVVADRDISSAQRVAAACHGKTDVLQIDVTDAVALNNALEQVDICLNLVGPFFKFGVPILKAAIAARASYIDICDDPEPTLEMLALGPVANDAGVTAILGLGASPGVTNLLAMAACSALDVTHKISTVWSLDGDEADLSEGAIDGDGNPSAAVIHWLEQCSGTVKVWGPKGVVDVTPLQKRILEIGGFGRRTAWTVGHPEAITLPRTLANLSQSENFMILPPGTISILKSISTKINKGDWTLEDGGRHLISEVVSGQSSFWGRLATQILEMLPRTAMPPLIAQANGTKSGKPARATAYLKAVPPDGMAGITGIPLAIGAKLLIEDRGLTVKSGVFAPEAIIDPLVFFDELTPFCTNVDNAGRIGSDEIIVSDNDLVRVCLKRSDGIVRVILC